MRPHRLEVTAIGAFADTVTVDFDAMVEGGLFLLHGETGAGKSTLLDALGFALFGRIPGARGAARRLRSDHAAAGTRAQVVLEATIGGHRLRVTRSPEQTRAKKRGGGSTNEPAKVLLEQLDSDGWRTLSTRVGEADQEITDRLGMSADQFFQVILLPQGEFARFLRAPSEERAQLLERLFEAERFGAVEDWLAQRRRDTAAALERHREAICAQAALIAQIAEIDPPEEPPESFWGTDLCVQHSAAVEVAAGVLVRTERELAVARGRAEATRLLAGRQERLRGAQLRAAELARRREELDSLAIEEERSGAAALVMPLSEAVRKSAEMLETARAADDLAARRLVAIDIDPTMTADELRRLSAEHQNRTGRLGELASVAQAAADEETAAARATAESDEAGARAAEATAAVEELTTQRGALFLLREHSRAAALALPAAARRADLVADAAATAAEIDHAEAKENSLKVRHLEAREHAQGLAEIHHNLRKLRLESLIAQLAMDLREGQACPVCGSAEHPNPMKETHGIVGADLEEAAAESAEQARTECEELGRALAAASTTLAARKLHLATLIDQVNSATEDQPGTDLAAAALPSDPDLATLTRCAAHTAAARDELAQSAGAGAERDRLIAALEQEISAATAGRQEAAQSSTAAARESQAAAARADAARARLAERLDGAIDLADALERSVQAADACTEAAVRREALSRTLLDHEAALRRAQAAAHQAGFADLAAATAAHRDPEWRAEAIRCVREHQRAVDGTAALLADPELAVDLLPPADSPAAAAAEAQATARHEAAVAALAHARRQVLALGQRVPALTALLESLSDVAERAETVRRTADLTAGQGANVMRMTLSAFVLAARLEEIAIVAGQRLLRMTGGRYTLVHTDSGRGARRAGLGLLARDHWTGVDRDTATLSGGETFLASLALALALADVVCAEAGGSRLESLFIDEGFGSLDEDTLDEVMDVLDGLREGGRVVGIVSHVAELRQRIPTRLHVRKHHGGSDVEMTA